MHWLGIQDREFPGTISGTVDADRIGPAASFEVASVPGSEALLREVDVRGSVTFSFQPDAGDAITLSRSLDGPMRLLFDERHGTWTCWTSRGTASPSARSFEIVGKRGTTSGDGIDLAIDAFVSVPYWQFFLAGSTDRVARLASKDAVLLDADGERVARRERSRPRSVPCRRA